MQGTEPAGIAKEAVLAWISAAAGTSTVRTSGGETKGVIEKQPLRLGSSDSFSLGLLGLCLSFCKPFLGGDQKHLDRLEVAYYSQHAYRCSLLPAATDVLDKACQTSEAAVVWQLCAEEWLACKVCSCTANMAAYCVHSFTPYRTT